MQTYLAPKKRLIPLLVVSIIFLLAVLLALFWSPNHLFLVIDIGIPIIIVALLATWWLSRKQLDSLYLMMNNAYLRYRQGVASQMIDYDTFVGNFMEENDPDRQHYRYWRHMRHHTDTLNRNFVHRLLTDHREEAERHFSQEYEGHELPLEKFKELCELNKIAPIGEGKSETTKEMPSSGNCRPTSKPSKAEDNRRSFESVLTDKDIELLVECINKLGIIETYEHEEITADDLKDFLDSVSKPECRSLVLIKNKEFAYLFKSLSAYRLIAAQWQAPIYQNHLLVTFSKKEYITRQNLSVSANKAAEVPPDGAQVTDQYIDTIRQLHRLK